MLPQKISISPWWFTTTSLIAVPVALVLSLMTCALVSSVTFGCWSAGRTPTTSASDLAWTSKEIRRSQDNELTR
jgi:hypothetical protein